MWIIEPSSGNVTESFVCSHEEVDTHTIYHTSLQRTITLVIVANNSEILLPGAYAYAMNKSRRWFYNYEAAHMKT